MMGRRSTPMAWFLPIFSIAGMSPIAVETARMNALRGPPRMNARRMMNEMMEMERIL